MKKLIHIRLYVGQLICSSILLFSSKATNTSNSFFLQYLNDTTAFSANGEAGWTTHTCYLKNLEDSVEFELILFRDVPTGNNWSDPSEAGTVKVEFAPAAERVFEYSEHPRKWKIIIQTNGKCFFQLLSGPNPQGTSIVFPMITKYKK